MSLRTLIWVAVAVALTGSIVGAAWSFFGTATVVMHREEIQQRIDAQLPHTTKHGVTISRAVVVLSGDQIHLEVDASSRKLKTDFTATAATTGKLRYDSFRGAFFFQPDEIVISDLTVNGTGVREKIGSLIDKWGTEKMVENKDDLVSAGNEAVHSLIYAGTASLLDRVPVYKLPSTFKGHIVRMLLKRVEVQDDTIVAHLSIWQLTWMLFIYLMVFLGAIAMLFALMKHPELGLALVVFGCLDN